MKNKKENIEDLIFKIVKEPTKKGDQYYFNIPIEFIRSGKVKLNNSYELLCFKIKED